MCYLNGNMELEITKILKEVQPDAVLRGHHHIIITNLIIMYVLGKDVHHKINLLDMCRVVFASFCRQGLTIQ